MNTKYKFSDIFKKSTDCLSGLYDVTKICKIIAEFLEKLQKLSIFVKTFGVFFYLRFQWNKKHSALYFQLSKSSNIKNFNFPTSDAISVFSPEFYFLLQCKYALCVYMRKLRLYHFKSCVPKVYYARHWIFIYKGMHMILPNIRWLDIYRWFIEGVNWWMVDGMIDCLINWLILLKIKKYLCWRIFLRSNKLGH